MGMTRLLLIFLLLGQNGLHHVAGLGDMREVDFWRYALRSARGRTSCVTARARSTLNMCADFLCLVRLQGTGVSLAGAQAEFRQNVKNLPALDFHLAREIVDTNLTHPPLFSFQFPKHLVAHGYLVAMDVYQTSMIIRLALEVVAHTTRRPL
jgi:hypothetical protein